MWPVRVLSFLLLSGGARAEARGGQQCTGTDGKCEDLEEGSLLQSTRVDLHRVNATRSGCGSCAGTACCCFTDCGQVGSYHLDYDIFSGSYWGELQDNGRGEKVSYNENAALQCDQELAPHFVDPKNEKGEIINQLKSGLPCCLYTGDMGFEWAVTQKSCNALEATPAIKQLITPSHVSVDGKKQPDHVNMCPGVNFPTMFWETLSRKWAQYLDNNPNCHKQIFVLIPDVHKLGYEAIAKKISFRIELDALGKESDIYIVTNDDCKQLHAEVCKSGAIRRSLDGKKTFCIENFNVDQFKYVLTFINKASKFDCHWWDGIL